MVSEKAKVIGTFILAATIGVIAVALDAQQTVIKPGAPVTLAWEFDAPAGDFRLWCGPDAKQLAIVENFPSTSVSRSTSMNASGFYTYTATTAAGLQAGIQQCAISSYGAFGETRSEPITVLVGVPPTAPRNVRVVK